MSTPALAPCGTYNALRRHRRAGETCAVCIAAHEPKPLAPCGTMPARRRHKVRGETCETCAPKPVELQPCGTPAAYRRHKKQGEDACGPCYNAFREWDTANRRAKGVAPSEAGHIDDLIEEIEWFLHLNQGSGYIIQAIGYKGRERSLGTRLQRHGRNDLYRRVTMMEEAA